MRWQTVILLVIVLGHIPGVSAISVFPPSGVTLTESWGQENARWDGQANFHGQIVVSACILAMEDAWQVVNLGNTPIGDSRTISAGSEKRFQIHLRDCGLADTGKKGGIGNRIQITFDGLEGETPDKFSIASQAREVELQIVDSQGSVARVGKAMSTQVLKGSEQSLDYTLRVVRNNKPLRMGNSSTSLGFIMNYE